MCLITTQQTPHIAQEDRRVYKLLHENLMSPYNCFHYELDKLHSTPIKENNEWCCFDNIDEAWLDNYFPYWRREKHPELKCFGPGYHSATTRQRLVTSQFWQRLVTSQFSGEFVFECTIPKGSEYYEDATGLVISNQIIINKIHREEDDI